MSSEVFLLDPSMKPSASRIFFRPPARSSASPSQWKRVAHATQTTTQATATRALSRGSGPRPGRSSVRWTRQRPEARVLTRLVWRRRVISAATVRALSSQNRGESHPVRQMFDVETLRHSAGRIPVVVRSRRMQQSLAWPNSTVSDDVDRDADEHRSNPVLGRTRQGQHAGTRSALSGAISRRRAA